MIPYIIFTNYNYQFLISTMESEINHLKFNNSLSLTFFTDTSKKKRSSSHFDNNGYLRCATIHDTVVT